MLRQKLGAADCAGCNGQCTGTCGLAPIGGQISPSGYLSQEAGRVNSIGYTTAELSNLFRLAQITKAMPGEWGGVRGLLASAVSSVSFPSRPLVCHAKSGRHVFACHTCLACHAHLASATSLAAIARRQDIVVPLSLDTFGRCPQICILLLLITTHRPLDFRRRRRPVRAHKLDRRLNPRSARLHRALRARPEGLPPAATATQLPAAVSSCL